MKISLCMIVKNEEQVLSRCLDSIKDFVDEIVIVDTGSTDSTKQIAKKYTEKVYDFEWIDDFSKARNFSFSKATGDYIMWLDADDVIEKSELDKLLKFKPKIIGDVDVYRLKYHIKFNENNNPTFSYFRERILKNDKTFFWQDPIHEAITPHGIIQNINIAISHRKMRPNPPMRNLNIYENLIKNNVPFSSRQKFYYSRELMYNAFYKEAIQSFTEYLTDNTAWVENRIEACQNLALCYEKTQNLSKALEILFYSFNFGLPKAEILCNIGYILLKLNRLNEAIHWYKQATKLVPNYESGAFVQKEYYDIIPYLQLCVCYYKLGELKRSKYYNSKAEKINPNSPAVLYNKDFFSKLYKKKK